MNDLNLFHESKIHGSKDYPIEYYENDIPKSYRHMRPHWHEEFEITLIEDGRLNYVIGQEHLDTVKGDLLFISPDLLHAAHQYKEETARTATIVFSLNLVGLDQDDRCTSKYIRPFMDHMMISCPVLKAGAEYYNEALQCFQELWNARELEFGKEMLVKSTLYKLMFIIWKSSPEQRQIGLSDNALRNIERLKPVITYIHEHCQEPMNIDELAKISGFSSVHFMNLFKKVFNTSCLDYIITNRIFLATEALKETDAPIMKIAMDYGFRNVSYFNRKFKAIAGCTPSEYRKRNKQ